MTPQIEFLTIKDVIEIHRDQIIRYGGDPTTRDFALLDSAVHVPQATMGGEYLLPGLFEMAGALANSLVKNHAFVDGNKRSGIAAALVLSLNGIEIRKNDDELYRLGLNLATGAIGRQEAAGYFRLSVEARSSHDSDAASQETIEETTIGCGSL